jgi:nucleotide-binding universal stress UspA family protein
MYTAIVVGTDGSARAARAVAHAAELAKLCGAQLHVVNAYKGVEASMATAMAAGAMVTTPPGIGEVAKEEAEANQEALEAQVAELRADGLEVKTHSVTGNPAAALLDVVEEVGAGLLVVGNRGLTGAKRILGSVPSSLSHHAPCALLIVHTEDS